MPESFNSLRTKSILIESVMKTPQRATQPRKLDRSISQLIASAKGVNQLTQTSRHVNVYTQVCHGPSQRATSREATMEGEPKEHHEVVPNISSAKRRPHLTAAGAGFSDLHHSRGRSGQCRRPAFLRAGGKVKLFFSGWYHQTEDHSRKATSKTRASIACWPVSEPMAWPKILVSCSVRRLWKYSRIQPLTMRIAPKAPGRCVHHGTNLQRSRYAAKLN